MNAGIMILQDGTPCIFHDADLPGPVVRVVFDYADYLLSLVYVLPAPKPSGTAAVQGSAISRKTAPTEGMHKLEYPLDSQFADLLIQEKTVGVARIQDGQVSDIKKVSVEFIHA